MIGSAWGLYPQIECQRFQFDSESRLKAIIDEQRNLIPYGNGRSYGDSALNTHIIDVKPYHYFLDFDAENGLLQVQAGVLLCEIVEHFVPRGWFLKVTPGTKLITVGGAIASDVHGKNHHAGGCFSESIKEFRIMLPDGRVVTCSKAATPELFHATCGGQGLTGIILEAKIYLKKINSQYIDQTTIKTRNLKETFAAFAEQRDKPYSVAWIDSLAKGDGRGRCLLMTGDFRKDGRLDYKAKRTRTIPFNFPSWVLNKWSARAFNWCYYHTLRERISHQTSDIDSFFYPLDALGHWNRIYGKNGFTQYQFILPKETSYEGLQEILGTLAAARQGSFLSVLKLYGKANRNWLSFPLEGYSLTLDFKIEKGLFAFLDRLDQIVVKYQGRIYLSKDARVSKAVFEQGYPQIETFRQFRKENQMDQKFQSLQSRRLGI